ncbi:hypothetical protein [Asticcacaulis biprosthecium]|uniref:hypothetical protein n=1 Tax=Asticcacaulis biprosthecium TaxID=76891 RepID=UPI0002E2C231|nr:hypothetical protein [Asticcacaulis biprosthecium]
MRTKLAMIAAMSIMAMPGFALAAADLSKMTPGYTYYNKSGATIADHDVEVVACATEAMKVQSFGGQVNRATANGLLGFMISDALSDAADRGAFAISLENCMVVHGWRVVRVPDAEGKKLAKLPPAELVAQISP